MDRKYKNNLKIIKEYSKKGVEIIIRHDVDFDIEILEKMLEIEKNLNISSIVYFLPPELPNSPYTIEDISNLYQKYKDHGFKFGLHLNYGYFTGDFNKCIIMYNKTIELFKNNGIELNSHSAHGYELKYAGPMLYDNFILENDIDKQNLPTKSFHKVYQTSDYSDHIYDSGGKLISVVNGEILNYKIKKYPDFEGKCYSNNKEINYTVNKHSENLLTYTLNEVLKTSKKIWLLFHPEHYTILEDNNLYYNKFINLTIEDRDSINGYRRKIRDYEIMLRKIKEHIPIDIHAVFSIKRPIILSAIDMLYSILIKNYTKRCIVYDGGGGWGCLGLALIEIENVKYICNDLNEDLIQRGKDIYKKYFDYLPNFVLENFYNLDSKNITNNKNNVNIFTHLDYENGSPETGWFKVDYNKIYSFAKNFDYIVISICKENCKNINIMNPYTIIDEDTFENMFCKTHNIISKDKESDNWRIVYSFKKKIL